MKKDVEIKITGTQELKDENGRISKDENKLLATGEYTEEKGIHKIKFEEVTEEGVFNSVIKISEKHISGKPKLTFVRSSNKKIIAQMTYICNEETYNKYVTPVGEMVINVETKDISFSKMDNQINALIKYNLGLGEGEKIKSRLHIEIKE
ncbi:MAG: DUF1934 domain-containing protein [Lachnospiraceae bacterium]|jgi:uncharacterized beta-barrel protein YwiB (DUF1934 family)|nr:DUF1934 domain-containing protein [Lachnospiraceae bacterium]